MEVAFWLWFWLLTARNPLALAGMTGVKDPLFIASDDAAQEVLAWKP